MDMFLKGGQLCSRLSKPFHHRLNGIVKKCRGQDRSIKENGFIIHLLYRLCPSVATIAAIDRPIKQAACLVIQRVKSVAIHSLGTASGDKPSP